MQAVQTFKSALPSGRQQPHDRARKLLRMRYLSENSFRAGYLRHPGFASAPIPVFVRKCPQNVPQMNVFEAELRMYLIWAAPR